MRGEDMLSGGTVTTVVRVGDTVRRTTGFWSSSVHKLLQHLHEAGFVGAPRFLGTDEKGREVLSFIVGDVTIDGPPRGMHTTEALSSAASLLRALHDATVGFVPPEPATWQIQVGAPTAGPVICHNDVGPYNTVYRAGRPFAFIDWDLAAPGPREWDIAYALWRFVPLYDDAACQRLGWPIVPRGPRISRLLDAYGLDRRDGLFDTVLRRMEVTRVTIRSWADAGLPQYARLVREGRLNEIADNIRYVEQGYREWKPFLH